MAIKRGKRIILPEGEKGANPTTQSPLAGAFKHFGLGEHPEGTWKNALVKDDDRTRRALIGLETAMYGVLNDSLARRLPEAKKYFEPGQEKVYTQEARQARALEAVKPALERYEQAMRAELDKHIKALEDVDALIDEALEPEFTEGQDFIAELRAREVREGLLAMPEVDRIKFLFDSGEKAALEVLDALKRDPMKRHFADDNSLSAARMSAINAQVGGPELLELWQFKKDVLVAAGVRAQLLDVGVSQGLQFIGMSYRYPSNMWQVPVNEALAKSEAVLL